MKSKLKTIILDAFYHMLYFLRIRKPRFKQGQGIIEADRQRPYKAYWQVVRVYPRFYQIRWVASHAKGMVVHVNYPAWVLDREWKSISE